VQFLHLPDIDEPRRWLKIEPPNRLLRVQFLRNRI
jgi:hypothetical protein